MRFDLGDDEIIPETPDLIFFAKMRQPAQFLKFLCIMVIVALSAIHLLVQISLFADGSSFLVVLLKQHAFFKPDPTRSFATIITQSPVLLAIILGLKNINLIIYIQTFGLLVFPTTLWIYSLIILRNDPLYWPFILLISIVYLNTSFFAIGESHIAYSVTACCMAILLSHRTINLPRASILLVLSFIVMRTYEALLFLGPLLSLMTALRLRETRNQRLVTFILCGAILLFLAASAIAASSILNPVAPDSFTEALTVSIIYRDRQLLLSFALSFIYLIYLILGDIKEVDRACTIAAAATLFLLAIPANWALPRYYYDCRIMVALWLFGFGMIGIVIRIAPYKLISVPLRKSPMLVASMRRLKTLSTTQAYHRGMWTYLPLFLMIVLAAIDVYHSVQFRRFAEDFAAEIDSRRGIVALEATNILDQGGKYYGWRWTYPTTSLLLRADETKAIILNANDYHGFQPFDPQTSLPDLRSYYKSGATP